MSHRELLTILIATAIRRVGWLLEPYILVTSEVIVM